VIARLFLLLLLALPAAAHADPISIFAGVLAATGSAAVAGGVAAAAGFLASYGAVVGLVAVNVYGAAAGRRKARAAAARQRAEYNSRLQDRNITALTANPPWRVIYGRCIVGGDVVAIFSTDKTGTRSDGSSFDKPDGYKHLVIVVAAHQVQAIHEAYIDGQPFGTLDGSGWVTGGAFYIADKSDVRTVSIPASSYVDVSAPVVAVLSSYITASSGLDETYTSQAVTLSLGNTRITNPAGSAVTVKYTITTGKPRVRMSTFLGTDSQTVDPYLNGLLPTQWDSSCRLRGLAGAVVTLDLDEPRFQGGIPTITFDTSGRLVEDTRTSTTAYSANNALIVRDWLLSPWGHSCDAAEVDTVLGNTAANACDARSLAAAQAHAATCAADTSANTLTFASERWFSTGDGVRFTTTGTLPAPLAVGTTYYVIVDTSRSVFRFATSIANAAAGTAIDITTTGTGTHTGTWYDYATYTCNGAFTTADSREAVLEDLCESMAGFATYGATWGIVAGAWTSSVMTLTDDDLDGQIEIVQAGAGLDSLFNGLRGQYIAAGKSTPSDFDSYANATFVAADGEALWSDIALPFTDTKARARNLARIFVERNRDGLIIRYPAKLRAFPLQIGDRVTVTSSEYGFSAKTFRVTDWQFGLGTAVQLTLQEDAAAVYDLADAATADPAPNTALPDPWTVAALTNVTAVSNSSTVLRSGSSPLVPRILVEWDAVTAAYVADGTGSIEVLWQRPGGPWRLITEPGDATSTYIVGPNNGDPVIIEARARNGLGQVGPSVFIALTVSGGAALIKTNELDDGAASATVEANAAGPVSMPFFTYTQVMSLTLGPYDVDTRIVATFTGQIDVASSLGPPVCLADTYLEDSEAGAGSAVRSVGITAASASGSVSLTRTVDLPSGVTGWIKAMGRVDETGDYSNMTFVAAVHKR
jgi:hypothetical protein